VHHVHGCQGDGKRQAVTSDLDRTARSLTPFSVRQVYDDPDAVKLNDVCEFVGVLSRVPGLAAAQLEAQTGGGGGGPAGDSDGEGLLEGDQLARDEALAMPPTSLVRASHVFSN